jgi:cobalt/nickel transport system ATP-binding protein
MLDISEISVIYPDGTRALDKFSLRADAGESVALVGANGAGKTTLMLAIMGILPLAEGRIEADGILLEKKNLGEIRARVNLIFQNPDDQLFMATIYDDIAFGLRNYGLPEDVVREKTDEALSELGISHLRDHSSLKLSEGEKRLAAIASVLSMRPPVLLFDEPTAFLDLKARRNLIHLLNNMNYTKIIASHDLAFLEEVCTRAVLIKDGSVFAEGPAKEFFRDKKIMEGCGLEAMPALQ